MSRNDRWVYLVPVVEAFRQSLTPDEQEAFNELLIRIYLDPKGLKTGAMERVRPPDVFYACADEQFGVLYRVYKLSGDSRERVEVFRADRAS